MTCDPFAQLDGAYSIGALDADDLAAYEAHLRTCAGCRARVEELRPTVRMLAAARGAVDPIVTALPDTVLPALLRRADRERARRRWTTRGLATLAAACLIALVVVIWPVPHSRPPAQALVSVRTSPVHATARLVSRSWGTEIDVHCKYARYARQLTGDYTLQVIDTDRRTYDLGAWALTPDREITFTGGTAVRRERIARVQITLADGTPILQLAL